MKVETIPLEQAKRLIEIGEGQFTEVKSIEVRPAMLTKTLSAFANTDGGDLYVGVDEASVGGGVKQREWRGFHDVEAATSHLQPFDGLFPAGQDFQYEFIKCDALPGLVLHIQVARTQLIVKASDGISYVRRGASNQPVKTSDAMKRLEYTKGVASFERQTVNADKAVLVSSSVIETFLSHVIPTAKPEPWLKKQTLLVGDLPTVAGLVLFAEEPQAVLPKLCGVKVYRYKTKETYGFRDALDFAPRTVEGCLYNQIKDAVRVTAEITEAIPKLGTSGLEKVKYPTETLHEIITNAVIHRDYSIADDIHIRIFDNRVEVQSPGRLPAHVTVKNILDERFARNGAIVRLLNKFPDPPNKDVGEGLNTAFEKMTALGLRPPVIEERDNDVLVTIHHESLATVEDAVMQYLEEHPTINNRTARKITHVKADHQMKNYFKKLEDKGLIEQVPGTERSTTAYRKKQPNRKK